MMHRTAYAGGFTRAFGLLLLATSCTAEIDGTRPTTPGAPGNGGTSGASGASGAAGSAASAGATATGGTGNVGTSGTGGNGTGGGSAGVGGGGTLDPRAAGPLPLRHLTSREYRNTVVDLLGDSSLAEDDVPNEATDPTFAYFPFRLPGSVGVVEAEALRFAGETLAKNLTDNVGELLPCSPESDGEANCAAAFIADFGPRAYRRPLDTGEIQRLQALYDRGRAELALDFDGAIALVIEAILQSPAFYYHFEREVGPAQFDPATQVVTLGSYQLASRLSYFLWGSMPDDALFQAAESGALSTEDGVAAEARRLLQSERARETVSDFFDDLFDLDVLMTRSKDLDEYPAYDSELQAAMRAEVQQFAARTVFEGDGTFEALLTSTRTRLNAPLAALYGVSGVNGTDFVDADLNMTERSGLLTLAGVLANSAAAAGSLPPRRGKLVLTRLLCTDLPPPPPDVPAPPEPQPGVSTRERFEAHGQNPCAAGCHILLDSLGFAFENYDGVGAYRATDMGKPVDASGSFYFDGVNAIGYDNALELAQLLAADPGAQACFAKQWLRYAFKRPEADGDAFSLESALAAFNASGGDVRELLVALTMSPTFRSRAVAQGEVLP